MSPEPLSLLPALEGVRVVESAAGVAGALCGHALAELGADVVSVVPPGGVPRDHPRATLGLLKRTVTLDQHDPAALEALLSDAAVFIEERGPTGWAAGAPIGPRVAALRPDIVAVCLSPFGLTGPYANYAAYPLTVYHAGGHAQQIPRDPLWPQYRVRAPLQAGGDLGEAQAGILAAVAILAYLINPDTRHGALIDCAKFDALVSMNWTEVVRYPNEGRTVTRLEPWVTFVGGVLPASDGAVQIVIMEDHQWQAAMTLLGSPVWREDPRLATQAARIAHCEDAARALATETVKYSRADLFERGQALGLPIAPILSPAEVLRDPALEHRGAWYGGVLRETGSIQLPTWGASIEMAERAGQGTSR